MEKFLRQFSTIPREFIKDFYTIAKDEYRENEIIIDFEKVCKWLKVRKDHLKLILVDNFEEKYDYSIAKKTKKHKKSNGASFYEEILITPNCFKELCMISQTKKAKEVRKYFIEMEKLVKRYHTTIKDSMHKEIGLLKKNQKPKLNIKGGVLYILRALNTGVKLYKIGKTTNLKKRLNTYNSGLANEVEPEFIIPVKDIAVAENCLKALVKKFQYRKYKEVYEINIDVLKELVEICSEVSDGLLKVYEKKKKDSKIKFKRMRDRADKYFAYVDKE